MIYFFRVRQNGELYFLYRQVFIYLDHSFFGFGHQVNYNHGLKILMKKLIKLKMIYRNKIMKIKNFKSINYNNN